MPRRRTGRVCGGATHQGTVALALSFDLLFLKDSDSQKSFHSMHRCPTSRFERLRIILHVYHTQDSGEELLNLKLRRVEVNCFVRETTQFHRQRTKPTR